MLSIVTLHCGSIVQDKLIEQHMAWAKWFCNLIFQAIEFSVRLIVSQWLCFTCNCCAPHRAHTYTTFCTLHIIHLLTIRPHIVHNNITLKWEAEWKTNKNGYILRSNAPIKKKFKVWIKTYFITFKNSISRLLWKTSKFFSPLWINVHFIYICNLAPIFLILSLSNVRCSIFCKVFIVYSPCSLRLGQSAHTMKL